MYMCIQHMHIVAWNLFFDTWSPLQSRTLSHFHATQTYRVVWGELQNLQRAWYSASYLFPKTAAINSSPHNPAACLFQKHNIPIICQLIPAWTAARIVNSPQHTLTRAQSSSLSQSGTRSRLTSSLILLSVLCVPDKHYFDLYDRGHAINILQTTLLLSTVSVFHFAFCCVFLPDLTRIFCCLSPSPL